MLADQVDRLVPRPAVLADVFQERGAAGLVGPADMRGERLAQRPRQGKGRVGREDNAARTLLDRIPEGLKALFRVPLQRGTDERPSRFRVGIIMLFAEAVSALLDQGQVQVAGEFCEVGHAGAAGLQILEQGLGEGEDRIGHRIDRDSLRLGPQEVLRGGQRQRGGNCVSHVFTTKTPLAAMSKQTRPA